MKPRARAPARLVGAWPWLVYALLGVGCGGPQPVQHGDRESGDCRKDADCPQGQRCTASRAHLRSPDGKIVGDDVHYACEVVPEPDGGPPP